MFSLMFRSWSKLSSNVVTFPTKSDRPKSPIPGSTVCLRSISNRCPTSPSRSPQFDDVTSCFSPTWRRRWACRWLRSWTEKKWRNRQRKSVSSSLCWFRCLRRFPRFESYSMAITTAYALFGLMFYVFYFVGFWADWNSDGYSTSQRAGTIRKYEARFGNHEKLKSFVLNLFYEFSMFLYFCRRTRIEMNILEEHVYEVRVLVWSETHKHVRVRL